MFAALRQRINTHANTLPLVVFVATLLFHALFWTVLPADYKKNENTDYLKYYRPEGRLLASGSGFDNMQGDPFTRYPPGYPLIIAGAYLITDATEIEHDTVMLVARWLFAATSATLLFLIARFFWSPLASLIVAFAWVLYPLNLWSIRQPNSETSFMTIFFAALLFFIMPYFRPKRAWWAYLVCGVLIGAATLIRPIAIGIGVVLGALLIITSTARPLRIRLLLAALLLAGNVAVITPWQLWLNDYTEEFTLISTSGSKGMVDGLTFAINPKDYRETPPNLPDDVIAFQRATYVAAPRLKENMPALTDYLKDAIAAQPGMMFKFFLIKAARSWYGTDSMRYEKPILLVQIIFLIGIGIAAWRIWRHRWGRGILLILVFALMGYFWAMTIMALSIVRYMLPAIALLILLLPGLWTGIRIGRETR